MGLKIRKMQYFKSVVKQKNIKESDILTIFSNAGINYLAFNAEVITRNKMKFTFYPEESKLLSKIAKENNISLEGPYFALHIEGDNTTGACADIFRKLSMIDIKTSISFGIADINKSYGIVVYLEENDVEKAIETLSS
jgi:hypothetical protein